MVDTKEGPFKSNKKVFVNKKVKILLRKKSKSKLYEYYLNDKSIGKSDIVVLQMWKKRTLYFHTIKSFVPDCYNYSILKTIEKTGFL